jgi:hypothetical protein
MSSLRLNAVAAQGVCQDCPARLAGTQILFICDGKGLHVPEYHVKVRNLV